MINFIEAQRFGTTIHSICSLDVHLLILTANGSAINDIRREILSKGSIT